jgi:primosomal protein N' (replication factor Y) (superfamily II helicase)
VEKRFALVAVARPLRGEFTYEAPDELVNQLVPGVRIQVPFGRGTALGFFLAFTTQAPSQQTKPITKILDARPALSLDVIELARFAATHYRSSLGETLKSALPPGMTAATEEVGAKLKTIQHVTLAAGVTSALFQRAPIQEAVVSYLVAVGGTATLDELKHAIPGSGSVVKKLNEKKYVAIHETQSPLVISAGLEQTRHEHLTAEQQVAVEQLTQMLMKQTYAPVLLQGVTGSGKTEVYLRLVERAVKESRGALILVPEIALTPQLLGRFQSRFGTAVAVLHSALKDSERLLAWQRLRSGELKIAVGVRSAIWAPVENLGLIVVDEEHDPSFKQDEKLRYNARDLAVVRAQKANCLVVLGSATPSLESLENANRGRYQKIEMKHRVAGRAMPSISLIDMRVHRPRVEAGQTELPMLSVPLREAISNTLAKKQQVILFLNRRGHSTLTVCEVCGENIKCKNCDVCLTHHLSTRRLECHYCALSMPVPRVCPSCSGPLLQLGVGTEKIEAEVQSVFPTARTARLDRDAVTTAEKLTALLSSFARREIDVLVGTQMVAKGHDFPGVTLVAVVMADTSLSMPDFRASERTFHLLTQVAGRAGRGEDAGHVMVQTYNPEAVPIARMLAHDYENFSIEELARRKNLFWPPVARMVGIRIEGSHALQTERAAKQLAQAATRALPPPQYGVRLLGPAPAPIARIKGLTRWQIILKAPTHAALTHPLDAIDALAKTLPSSVRVIVDVDPGAMM